MALRGYLGKFPSVAADAYVDESAQIIGEVTIGPRSSVWCNAVIRGDVNFIRIGEETNVQDLACLHVTHDTHPLVVGARVSIGHGANLHGCAIGDGSLIGIGAIVLDGAIIGSGSLVAAGTVLRTLSDEEVQALLDNAANYLRYQAGHREAAARAMEFAKRDPLV